MNVYALMHCYNYGIIGLYYTKEQAENELILMAASHLTRTLKDIQEDPEHAWVHQGRTTLEELKKDYIIEEIEIQGQPE